MVSCVLSWNHFLAAEGGHDASCDECKMFPIFGTRYKCKTCEDFDLCQHCKMEGRHQEHYFAAIKEDPDVFLKYYRIECKSCNKYFDTINLLEKHECKF